MILIQCRKKWYISCKLKQLSKNVVITIFFITAMSLTHSVCL